jgi:hypothetical protein
MANRFYYRNLFKGNEESDNAMTNVLDGSVPPGSDELSKYAR